MSLLSDRHVIRTATSCLCGIVLLGCSARSPHSKPPISSGRRTAESSLPVRRLALEEVLSWRKYAYLVGMTDEQVADTLGEPRERALWQDGENLTFQHTKTDNRLVTLRVVKSKVTFVQIYPKPDEAFDISELITRADQFKFTSGIGEGSTRSFLAATIDNLTIRIVTVGDDASVHPVLSSVVLH
jgi:hypothetical protein